MAKRRYRRKMNFGVKSNNVGAIQIAIIVLAYGMYRLLELLAS